MIRPRKEKLVASLVLVLVFGLGIIVGMHGARVATHRHIDALFKGTPEDVETHVITMTLERGLHLDDAQMTSVREILKRHAPEHARLREQIEPELVKLRAEERAELRAILTPAQQTKFDSMKDKLDDRRKRLAHVLDH